ncbi:hypothetical protein P2G88_13015 [Aliiglaciecola sp. CAU 1673]|uniref:hypothetical protein n=1 Tax=Aliiglaciecola sp. CAU 1673 TaxID=3032595 RepID=UPI0023DA6BB3|nr:hypothetical protein [Aliiglaciecola sp. CAU 1673]MDF2179174.1 hypothetical protein [Aliiglaciecola sp. CAU 1673]
MSGKDGKFKNWLEGHLIVSEYTGAFSAVGIRAIVADVVAKAGALKHWCWYQKPSTDAGITPDAIHALIKKYQLLDQLGCCAVGVKHSNVLVNAFALPKDGSIKIPFKVSKDEHALLAFFAEKLQEKQVNAEFKVLPLLPPNNRENLLEEFLASANLLGFTPASIERLIGLPVTALLGTTSMLSKEAIAAIQHLVILERLMLCQLDNDTNALRDWFVTPLAEFQRSPMDLCQSRAGLRKLYSWLNTGTEASRHRA